MKNGRTVIAIQALIVLCLTMLPGGDAISGTRGLSEKEYLALPAGKIDIAEGALIIAKDHFPELNIKKYLRQINTMTEELRKELRGVRDASGKIKTINTYLFKKQNFKYEENGRFLNELLDHKKGNCLALSTLYLSLADRIKLPLYAVLAPEHLFVRYDDHVTKINIETTQKGKTYPDDKYIIKSRKVSRLSIKNGVYLKSLTEKQFFSDILVNRSFVWLNMGQYDKTIEDCDMAITLNPEHPGAYNNRGLAWNKKVQYEKAVYNYKKGIKENPISANASAFSSRVDMLYDKGKFEKAIHDCTMAIKLDPKFAKAYYNRGLAWNTKGDYDKAIKDYTSAIKLNPKYARAYYNRGRVFGMTGRYEKAIRDCTKAIGLNRKEAKTYYDLRGFAHYANGDTKLACIDWKKACKMGECGSFKKNCR